MSPAKLAFSAESVGKKTVNMYQILLLNFFKKIKKLTC
jgi:hypothetical protein